MTKYYLGIAYLTQNSDHLTAALLVAESQKEKTTLQGNCSHTRAHTHTHTLIFHNKNRKIKSHKHQSETPTNS